MKKILVCFSGIFFLLFATGCEEKFPVQPSTLIGKSKKEVIALVMEIAERTSDHKVNFATKIKSNHHVENYYYETKSEAEQDERLLKSNIWQVFFTEESTLLWFGNRTKYIEIIFRNDHVYEYETGAYSDGM